MNNWLPVVATLSGAIVAGLISIFTQWLANRNSVQHTQLVLAEERARWATEKRLADLKDFFGAIEKVFAATQQFRIQQAWAASEAKDGTKAPGWVLSYNDAREGFENALNPMFIQTSLLDADVQAEFERSNISAFSWYIAKTSDDGVLALRDLEDRIGKFRQYVSQRYQKVFQDRRKGADHS